MIPRFPLLPDELSVKIYKCYLDNLVNIIIKNWYNYINYKITAISLISKLSSPFKFNYETLSCLCYCNKILSGKEDKDWWLRKINKISYLINDKKINYINLNNEEKNLVNNIEYYYESIIYKFK